MSLEAYGWDNIWAQQLELKGDTLEIPARVIAGHRSEYRVHTGERALKARAAGKLYHPPFKQTDLPAVGDWVILSDDSPDSIVTIQKVLTRRSTFSRMVAGKHTSEQIMATNVDTVWIVTNFEGDFNLSRLERYVTLVVESGAVAAIVLAKADLVEETEPAIELLRSRIPDVAIHAVSAQAKTGLDQLETYLAPGKTIALLGSSGVGKTTLINHFSGSDDLVTAEVREKDGKGRHTTTHRELILLPTGGVLLDTPGMRELQLWGIDEALENSFSDIDEFAASCRFSDCKHESEPGCAVNAAVESGDLAVDRFNNYLKLKSELKYVERKNDVKSGLLQRELWKTRTKEHKRITKEKKLNSPGKR